MRKLTIFALILGCLCFVGCGGSKSSTPVGDTLIYGRGEDASTLDPIHTDIGESVKVMINLYDQLVTYADDSMELVPSLAKEWSHSPDGLTWTFKLRDDVKFHDGTKFDADAVVFTFDRLLAQDDPLPRPYLENYRNIEKVAAKDPYTVEFTLKTPSAIFLQNLAMFPASIVSPTAVKKAGENYGEQPVGTGPFKFADWQRKQALTIDAFDDHWRGPPGVARVIFLCVGENATRAEQLKRGESHLADDLNPTELQALSRNSELIVQEQVGLNVAYLSMQMEKTPLQHRDVRRAIAHAIDKQELIKIAYGGKASPAVNMLPPSMWGHNNKIQDHLYDVSVAKQMLADCAKREGFELPVKLTLYQMTEPRPYLPQADQVASFVKDSLAKIGIEVRIVPNSVNQHFSKVQKGEHDLALAGWSSDNNDIDNFLFSLLDDNLLEKKPDLPVESNNLSRYRNPEVHQRLKQGQSELDRDKRLPLYLEAQQMIFDDVPTLPLVHAQFRVAHSKKLLGYKLHPSGLARLRLAHFAAPEGEKK